MKLLIFRNGETESEGVESIAAKSEHGARALILYLVSGDMALLKLEDAGEVARLIAELQG